MPKVALALEGLCDHWIRIEREAALPVKTPIGHTSATGLAADNVADDKESQTTDLRHEGWMRGEPPFPRPAVRVSKNFRTQGDDGTGAGARVR